MGKNSKNMHRQIQQWIRDTFHLSKDADIHIHERRHSDKKIGTSFTEIMIEEKRDQKKHYQIKKTIDEISEKDIRKLRRFDKFEKLKRLPVIGNLFRFLGLWLAFTGVYTMFSVCPFCGQIGCPVGTGSAGVVGGFFALIVQNMKNLLNFVHHNLAGPSK